VVIPVLNEAQALPALLTSLRTRVDELIVVDGGSTDHTAELALAGGARVLRAPRGRGGQLNTGAAAAGGERIWFLHADSGVPDGLPERISAAADHFSWGCCAVNFGDPDPRLRLTAAAMNRRARRSGSCTGDMGIWIHRSFFEELGGFAPLAALEDLDFSFRARRRAPWTLVEGPLQSSSRRWRREGINRTILRMWAIRSGFYLGVDPTRLAAWYRSHPR
jgi:rSAM/selenodomain-associated transferase 2